MKELMEMRDKRVQSWNAAKAFLESHRGEDGTLSAEDEKTAPCPPRTTPSSIR